MVVPYPALQRLRALSAWGMRRGARPMLPTPPAIIRRASPALMARAAVPTASRPEPHRRLMVEIGRASCRKECRSRWAPYHLKKKKNDSMQAELIFVYECDKQLKELD